MTCNHDFMFTKRRRFKLFGTGVYGIIDHYWCRFCKLIFSQIRPDIKKAVEAMVKSSEKTKVKEAVQKN